MELYLTPKPGLVDRLDNGSHPDLSVPLMEQSIGIVNDYLREIVVSLRADEPFICQRDIAIRAERRLYDELGTNTHKGYIFLSGMLLIARHHAAMPDETCVRESLSTISRAFFDTAGHSDSNGEKARRKYHAGGIVSEAIGGYPSLFDAALPAFRAAFARYECVTTASFAMMARLMQCVDDTTTLHRAGPGGLARVKRDGARLERAIAEGGDHHALLVELNHDYVRANITIGGVADLVGICYALLIVDGEIEAGI